VSSKRQTSLHETVETINASVQNFITKIVPDVEIAEKPLYLHFQNY